MIFEVANTGDAGIELARARVVLEEDRRAVFAENLERERTFPTTLEPHGSFRLWTRAKWLAGRLEAAGFGGTPRLVFVVEDGMGRSYEKRFRFRAGEYLDLKDE